LIAVQYETVVRWAALAMAEIRTFESMPLASLIATMAAINFDPRGQLRSCERAVCMCLAVDKAQARIVHGYVKAYFECIPALKALVTGESRNSLSLSNGVDIETFANDYKSLRGRSLLLVIFDELAFWSDESGALPNVETALAVAPGLARIKNSMLVMISSVHRRDGRTIQRSLEQDREKFGAEYLSEWRDDLSAFITRDHLERLVERSGLSAQS
jgi:hypothetical protein